MAEPVATLGFVAIGRNEGDRLVRCLASIAKQGAPVVYVDSASNDGSVAAARAAGALVLALDPVRPFTAARARSEGADLLFKQFSQIGFVMFIDGDCEVEARWPDAAARFLAAHPDFAVVCGRRRERFPRASFYNEVIDGEWDSAVGEALACGGDSVVRANAYRAVGGFDPAIVAGEEPELCSRLRALQWRIMRLDEPMTIHDAAIHRFGQWWRRAVRSGFGYAQVWSATRHRGRGALYRRELARAIGWAGLLPLASLAAGAIVSPIAVLLWPLFSAAQFVRMSLRVGVGRAALALAARYAELAGALRFAWRARSGSAGGTLVYK